MIGSNIPFLFILGFDLYVTMRMLVYVKLKFYSYESKETA